MIDDRDGEGCIELLLGWRKADEDRTTPVLPG